MKPGDPLTYRYCGHEYAAVVTKRPGYRVRVLRASIWAGLWQLLVSVKFTTGSGRTHHKEVSLGLSRDPETAALVEALAREGHYIKFPKNKTDTYTARRAWRKGWSEREKPVA